MNSYYQSSGDGCIPLTVALESIVISHGLPYPHNLRLALRLKEIVREGGAMPITAGTIAGEIVVGLSQAQIEHLATAREFGVDDLFGDSKGSD